MRARHFLAGAAFVSFMTGCAPKAVPPVAGAPAFPEFVFPVIPTEVRESAEAASVSVGWRYLQGKQLSLATGAFRVALRGAPRFQPARTGMAYVALADRDHADALTAFDDALTLGATYVPAIVGRGLSLLALGRDDDAIGAFEAALARDPSLVDLRRRVDVLAFRRVERLIETARSARDGGRREEASRAYERAIALSPESGFLYRELGAVERARGNRAAALARYREATRLDASDRPAWVAMAELFEAAGDDVSAERAYRAAMALEPSPDLSAKIGAVAARARAAALPAAFTAIGTSPVATRADLAALIGIRAPALLSGAPTVAEVVTDAGGHWAEPWITAVVRAGVIEPFPNHTFQPALPLRRIDLASVASRLMRLSATGRSEVREAMAARPRIADLGPQHPNYVAAAASVAAAVIPLRAGDRFEPTSTVSGAEAEAAVERLRTWLLERPAR
jgi:Tfp pilus assembly protein PilF